MGVSRDNVDIEYSRTSDSQNEGGDYTAISLTRIERLVTAVSLSNCRRDPPRISRKVDGRRFAPPPPKDCGTIPLAKPVIYICGSR